MTQKHNVFLDSDIIIDVLAMRISHYRDSAKSRKMDFIITRNKKDYKHSSIPACTPTEYLAFAKTQ